MLDRLKTALVESYVGAIAVGWLCSEGIFHLASAFTVPITVWMQQRLQQQQHPEYSNLFKAPPRFPFELALPQLLTALFVLAVAFAMLRWLYFPSAQREIQDQAPEPEESA